MSAFLGEIVIFSFNFAPRNWASCDGRLLSISSNQALFSLLGTSYGGDGRIYFGLPDFRGKIPIHRGEGHNQGETGGETRHTLTYNELPAHKHVVNNGAASFKAGSTANALTPEGNYFGNNAAETKRFSAHADAGLANAAPILQTIGGNQSHDNMQPYLVLNFCIALVGIFPSRN